LDESGVVEDLGVFRERAGFSELVEPPATGVPCSLEERCR
jgi:hypothetical protein